MRKRTFFATVVTITLSVAGPANANADELPTREETQTVFGDQINRYTFPLTNTSAWRLQSEWRRTTRMVIAPNVAEVDESGPMTFDSSLPDKSIQIFHRTNENKDEYETIEQAAQAPTNFFPVFNGLPQAFVFYDDTLPAASNQHTCRALREYLACRIIQQSDGTVSYETFMSGATKTPSPSKLELLATFADRLGRRTYAPTGVTSWELTEHWRRIAQIVFNAPDDERTVPPVVIQPIPKELRVFTRQNHGQKQAGLIEWADRSSLGMGELLNPFPIFRGNAERWTFYDTGLFANNNYEETCRRFHKRGTEFLLCRTILHGTSAFYQTYIRIAG